MTGGITGNLVIAEAGTHALATFAIGGHGTLSKLNAVGTRKDGDLQGGPGRGVPVRVQRGQR